MKSNIQVSLHFLIISLLLLTIYTLYYCGLYFTSFIISLIIFAFLYNYYFINKYTRRINTPYWILFLPLSIGLLAYTLTLDNYTKYFTIYAISILLLLYYSTPSINKMVFQKIATTTSQLYVYLVLALIPLFLYKGENIYWVMIGPVLEYLLPAYLVQLSPITGMDNEILEKSSKVLFYAMIPLIYLNTLYLTMYASLMNILKYLLSKHRYLLSYIIIGDYIIRIIFITGWLRWIIVY